MAAERGRAWLVGGLFFAFCFAIAAGLEQLPSLDGLGGALIAESIIIAGWVGIWHPLDLTLYAWWPHRVQRRLLDRIARLDVRLVAEEDRP
jgi:hypothetical protein